jgi:hypothetical protein
MQTGDQQNLAAWSPMEHRAQSTEHTAQSTERKAAGTPLTPP